MEAIVIVQFDEAGEISYHVVGDDKVRLFIVDDRAKSDRVYEWLSRDKAEDIKSILGDDPIGSSQDARHPAIEAVVNEHLGRGKRLRLVETD